MVTYEEVAEAAVKREMEIIGKQIAVKIAKETEGVAIDDDGNVDKIKGEGKEVIAKLVSEYEEKIGKVAVTLISKAIKEIGGDELDLPSRIEERM